MGRVKLEIKKIETAVGKQVTYSKRRAGIEKKAKELATLCDIDLVLILFSPAGKLSWINGSKSPPEEVIMRFASLSPQERAKRKCEALEQLKRVFKKLDHDVNVEEYTRTPDQSIDELNQHLEGLRLQFQHLQNRLQNYECYQTIDEAIGMENKLQHRLEEVRLQKQMLQTASQCLIPYDQQALQQQIIPGNLLPGPIQLDHSSSSWDSDHHKQHSAHSLENDSSPVFNQRDMQRQFVHNNLVECNNQFQAGMICDNLFGDVKNIHDLELKRENIGLEMEANCGSAVDYMGSNGGQENISSPPGVIGNGNGIPVHWMTNTLSNNMMSQQQATPQYLQHLNMLGNGPLPRNDIYRPDQNNSNWY